MIQRRGMPNFSPWNSRKHKLSRNFTADTDYITQGTVAIPLIGSIAFWLYPSWAQTDAADHLLYDTSSDNFLFEKYSDSNLYCGWSSTQIVTGSYTLNQNAWNLFVLTWDTGAVEEKLYLNGSQIGSTVAFAPGASFDTTGQTRIIGNASDFSRSARGRMAEYAIWDAALTAAEVLSLNARLSPVFIRPGNLTDYLPLFANASPEPNLFGGSAGTISSGTAKADHPPMIYASSPQVLFRPTPAAAFIPAWAANSNSVIQQGGVFGAP
jgi:hypothetical protein